MATSDTRKIVYKFNPEKEFAGATQPKKVWMVRPEDGYPINVMNNFMLSLPPNTRTEPERAPYVILVLVREGSGYSIIDGKRYEWSGRDNLCIPAYAWHHHVNDNPKRAMLLCTTSQPLFERSGLGSEHFEAMEAIKASPKVRLMVRSNIIREKLG